MLTRFIRRSSRLTTVRLTPVRLATQIPKLHLTKPRTFSTASQDQNQTQTLIEDPADFEAEILKNDLYFQSIKDQYKIRLLPTHICSDSDSYVIPQDLRSLASYTGTYVWVTDTAFSRIDLTNFIEMIHLLTNKSVIDTFDDHTLVTTCRQNHLRIKNVQNTKKLFLTHNLEVQQKLGFSDLIEKTLKALEAYQEKLLEVAKTRKIEQNARYNVYKVLEQRYKKITSEKIQ